LTSLDEKLAESGFLLSRHVRRELEAFLACGDPSLGFAWLRCPSCDEHRLVPFSCGGRAFCPACIGRRMEERARRWVDEILPRVAVRQWVLTVPWPRRWLLARRHDLARGVLRVALTEIERWLRGRGLHGGLPGGRGGSITVVQRFGSSLALNLHVHILALDGLYEREEKTGRLRWRRARAPTTEEVGELVVTVAERCERWLASQGFGDDDAEHPVDDDDVQGVIQAAAVAGRSAALGRKAKRFQVFGGRPFELPRRCAAYGGYTLHAGVV
ncbi:MAG: IS91 family transposase, partial [Proteobacteria bacterium]|nr:IS91 family transposase [Pseudomonadota bacterium]